MPMLIERVIGEILREAIHKVPRLDKQALVIRSNYKQIYLPSSIKMQFSDKPTQKLEQALKRNIRDTLPLL